VTKKNNEEGTLKVTRDNGYSKLVLVKVLKLLLFTT